jgi:hypothetical protein
MEVERLIVQDYALDHQKTVPSDSTDDSYVGYRNRPKLAKWVCLFQSVEAQEVYSIPWNNCWSSRNDIHLLCCLPSSQVGSFAS